MIEAGICAVEIWIRNLKARIWVSEAKILVAQVTIWVLQCDAYKISMLKIELSNF